MSDQVEIVPGMKLLTATGERQGERDGDFFHAIEGELVLLGEVYATHEEHPFDGRGCGGVFSGLRSGRATTTALVRDLRLTREDLELAIAARFAAAGISADLIGDLEYRCLFIDTVDDMIRFGATWPEYTVVRRAHDGVTIR